jgi:hypothetical protein
MTGDGIPDAHEVFLLMRREFRVSRNVRAKWFFDHLHKTVEVEVIFSEWCVFCIHYFCRPCSKKHPKNVFHLRFSAIHQTAFVLRWPVCKFVDSFIITVCNYTVV